MNRAAFYLILALVAVIGVGCGGSSDGVTGPGAGFTGFSAVEFTWTSATTLTANVVGGGSMPPNEGSWWGNWDSGLAFTPYSQSVQISELNSFITPATGEIWIVSRHNGKEYRCKGIVPACPFVCSTCQPTGCTNCPTGGGPTPTPTPNPGCGNNCPVSCQVGGWYLLSAGGWSACSNGQQTRSETWRRDVIRSAANNGAACPNLTEQRTGTQSCGSTAVDCQVSDWSAWTPGPWSDCNNGQRSRTETRTRSVTTHPSNGGQACPALSETRTVTDTAGCPAACGSVSIDSFNASPSTTSANQPVTFSWDSTGADNCVLSWSGGGSSTQTADGSYTHQAGFTSTQTVSVQCTCVHPTNPVVSWGQIVVTVN